MVLTFVVQIHNWTRIRIVSSQLSFNVENDPPFSELYFHPQSVGKQEILARLFQLTHTHTRLYFRWEKILQIQYQEKKQEKIKTKNENRE